MKIYFIIVYLLCLNLTLLNEEFHLDLDFRALNNTVDMVKRMDGLKTLLYSEYQKIPLCSDTNMSNTTYTSCTAEKAEALTKTLHLEYTLLLKKHHNDKVLQTKIKEAEKSWFKYLDADLAMAFPHMHDTDYYWTGLARCYYDYKNSLLEHQIKKVKNFDQRLQKKGCTMINTKGEED